MTGLPRLAFGTAVLTAERLLGRTSPRSPFAVAVGLAERGRQEATQAAGRIASAARRIAPPDLSMDRVRGMVHDAGARGAISMSRSRRDAEAMLRTAMDGSLSWAERTVVPKVVEDMLPYVMDNVVPRVIDGVMPQVRAKVLPVIVDDLAEDPKVRALISEQSQGMISDATIELRQTSADADEKVESTFRRLFSGH